MNSLCKLSALLMLCASFAACETRTEHKLHGVLYFGAGSYLGAFNIGDGSSTVVSSVGDANIRDVHEMQGNRVLLVMDVFENTREVSRISWLDTRTLQITALFQGVKVAWLPEFETYVYDDGARLSAVSLSLDQDTDNAILTHRLNAVSTIHVVSESAVIFDAGPRDARTIHHYDVETRILTSLDALAATCNLRASVWVADKQKIACRAFAEGGRYVLSSLDASDAIPLALPEDRRFRAVKALPGQGALIVTEVTPARSGGRPDLPVSAFMLESGELLPISGNQHLGDSVAYRY